MVNTITDLRLTDFFNCWNSLVPGGSCVKQQAQRPSVHLLKQSLARSFTSRPHLACFSDHRHLDHPNFSLLSPPPACHHGPHMVLLSPEQINASRTGTRELSTPTFYINTTHCLVWTRNTGLQNVVRRPVHPVWKVCN